jgi:membrane protease YdiL (CAAX protease family)
MTTGETPTMQAPRDTRVLARLAAIAETLLIVGVGSLAATQLAKIAEWPARALSQALLFERAVPNWHAAAQAEAKWLALRYGITFAVVLAVCLWRGRPTAREAGLSLGNRSVPGLIAFGVMLGLLLNTPVEAAALAQHFLHLGANTPMWDLMQRSEWTRDFWLYMAVASYGAIPLVEEFYFRSYALGRYRGHFSDGAAVLLVAVFFWVAHGQYLGGDAFLAFNSALLFLGALVLGWSVVHTGSVLPAIVAHVVINIPVSTEFRVAWVLLGLAALVLLSGPITRAARDLVNLLAGTREWLFLIIVAAALAGLVFAARGYPAALPLGLAILSLFALIGLFLRPPAAPR